LLVGINFNYNLLDPLDIAVRADFYPINNGDKIWYL